MTTVVAVARDGLVHMAADSATNVYDRPVLGVVKIRTHEAKDSARMLLGYAGDGALPSVVAAHLIIDAAPRIEDDDQKHQVWAEAVARAITELAIEHNLTEGGRLTSNVILGFHGRVWTLTHMQAIQHHDGLAALGSGEEPALGAVLAGLALGETDMPKLVHLAVGIACALDRYSDGGPHVVCL